MSNYHWQKASKGTDLTSTPISKASRALIIFKKGLCNLHMSKGTRFYYKKMLQASESDKSDKSDKQTQGLLWVLEY